MFGDLDQGQGRGWSITIGHVQTGPEDPYDAETTPQSQLELTLPISNLK